MKICSLVTMFFCTWLILVGQVFAQSGPEIITFDKGLLSISARDVPLQKLLDDLAAETKIEIKTSGEIDYPVSIELPPTPLEEALKRFIKPFNFSVIYSKEENPERQTNIDKIIIYNTTGPTGKGKGQKASGKTVSQTVGDFPSEPKRQPQITIPLSSDQDTSLQEYTSQLNDGDPDIRQDAVFYISDEYPEEALGYLEKVLLNDGNDEVKVAAAEAIGELGSKKGIASLEKGLSDRDEDVREAVVAALGELGGKEALQVLKKALKDRNEDIREEAQFLIEEIEEEDL